jgi:hypothetical protein
MTFSRSTTGHIDTATTDYIDTTTSSTSMCFGEICIYGWTYPPSPNQHYLRWEFIRGDDRVTKKRRRFKALREASRTGISSIRIVRRTREGTYK